MKKQDTKVKFDYAVLTLDDVKKQIKPTDAELKAFYDQNKQMYANSIPEKSQGALHSDRHRQAGGQGFGHARPNCSSTTSSIRTTIASRRR